MDELGVQAALTQRDTSSAEKKYGLRIDPRDCQAAGIKVHYDRKGETGIRLVDVKHVTLEGNQEQFSQLIGLTIARLWEGTECLCAFPAHQIVGQLAIFRKDERTGIEAKERCCISLSKTQQWFQELEDDDQIEVKDI